jgi:hypothetical protein
MQQLVGFCVSVLSSPEARPAPLLGASDQMGSERVAFDVTQHRATPRFKTWYTNPSGATRRPRGMGAFCRPNHAASRKRAASAFFLPVCVETIRHVPGSTYSYGPPIVKRHDSQVQSARTSNRHSDRVPGSRAAQSHSCDAATIARRCRDDLLVDVSISKRNPQANRAEDWFGEPALRSGHQRHLRLVQNQTLPVRELESDSNRSNAFSKHEQKTP